MTSVPVPGRGASASSSNEWSPKLTSGSRASSAISSGWKSTQRPDTKIVAGTQPLGVGQLLAQFDEDNDGTVAVSETRMPGATDHIILPVSHLGMLVSARVAHETGHFLTHGRFSLR